MWMYCLALSLELMLKIVYPFTTRFVVSVTFYHIICCTTTLVAVVYSISVDYIGLCADGTCLVTLTSMRR
jgi:hypothetical protein